MASTVSETSQPIKEGPSFILKKYTHLKSYFNVLAFF